MPRVAAENCGTALRQQHFDEADIDETLIFPGTASKGRVKLTVSTVRPVDAGKSNVCCFSGIKSSEGATFIPIPGQLIATSR